MLTFDREQMRDEIEALPKRLRVAFATACAQRQLLNYVRTSGNNPTGNPEAARRMLRDLWDSIEHNTFDLEKIQPALALCDALIPSYKVPFEGIEFAEDAILSLFYALETALSGASQETVSAAQHALSALDEYIIERFNLDINGPNAESHVESFPIMQAELSRQQVDLAELRAVALHPSDERPVIVRIKHRAEADSASFFG